MRGVVVTDTTIGEASPLIRSAILRLMGVPPLALFTPEHGRHGRPPRPVRAPVVALPLRPPRCFDVDPDRLQLLRTYVLRRHNLTEAPAVSSHERASSAASPPAVLFTTRFDQPPGPHRRHPRNLLAVLRTVAAATASSNVSADDGAYATDAVDQVPPLEANDDQDESDNSTTPADAAAAAGPRVTVADGGKDALALARRANAHTVLVGPHGSNLVSMLWLRPGSAVVELLPDAAPLCYRNLATALGLRYFAVAVRPTRDPANNASDDAATIVTDPMVRLGAAHTVPLGALRAALRQALSRPGAPTP